LPANARPDARDAHPRRSASGDARARTDAGSGTWTRSGIGEEPQFTLVREYLYPSLAVITLLACMLAFGQRFTKPYAMLNALTFVLCNQLMSRPAFEYSPQNALLRGHLPRILVEWGYVIAWLLTVGFVFKVTANFSRKLILTWIALTPLMLLGAQAAAHWVTGWRLRQGAIRRRLVIVGATRIGFQLAARLAQEPWLGTVDGYFDDRRGDRLPRAARGHHLGRFCDLPEYSRRNLVHVIYICLPIFGQARIQKLLEELSDSTASIYFVPDLTAFDLMQARFGEVRGLPLLAIRETPFCGTMGILKRASDIVLASMALLLAAPLMAGIAIGVRRGSPGPVLFRQRRYGMDGRQFMVYKFRTMTVCEDGEIRQATRRDSRVTPFGGFLRRSSLDELPQLFNVLGGTMSLVGPRPHAVAHNEHYRRVVNGYMLRHKVRPGITGLAQINGLRGETRSLETMSRRVELDIEYVKNWSLALDLRILLKTLLVFFHDRRAY